jgi:hypothetical protein
MASSYKEPHLNHYSIRNYREYSRFVDTCFTTLPRLSFICRDYAHFCGRWLVARLKSQPRLKLAQSCISVLTISKSEAAIDIIGKSIANRSDESQSTFLPFPSVAPFAAGSSQSSLPNRGDLPGYRDRL